MIDILQKAGFKNAAQSAQKAPCSLDLSLRGGAEALLVCRLAGLNECVSARAVFVACKRLSLALAGWRASSQVLIFVRRICCIIHETLKRSKNPIGRKQKEAVKLLESADRFNPSLFTGTNGLWLAGEHWFSLLTTRLRAHAMRWFHDVPVEVLS